MDKLEKKIGIVSSSAPPLGAGGISSAHYNLYKGLKNRGCDVRIFTFGDNGVKQNGEKDIIRRGTPPIIAKAIRLMTGFYFMSIDRTMIAYQLADILEAAIGSIKLNKPLKRFKPDVLILSDHGCPGFFIAKQRGCVTILCSHHNPMRFINEPLWIAHSKKDAHIALQIENRAMKKFDKVICPSHYMADVFKKTYCFDGPLTVIPNIVDADLIDSIPANDIRKDLALPADSALIYIPSAGSVIKGSRYVFEIVRRLAVYTKKEIGFYLSGGLNDILKRELSFIPDNAKVYMPGHLSFKENISIVKACSFAVSPTLSESFGMAILEANHCGLPVVTFNVGGNSDIIQNGENGFLVPYLDLEKLILFSESLIDHKFRADMCTRTVAFMTHKRHTEKTLDDFLSFIG